MSSLWWHSFPGTRIMGVRHCHVFQHSINSNLYLLIQDGIARYAKCFGLQPRFLGPLANDIKKLLKKKIYIFR